MRRVTFFGEKGTIYSYIEFEAFAEQMGAWEKPFPNTEGDSQALGLVELLLQCDECPPSFMYEDIVAVTVEPTFCKK